MNDSKRGFATRAIRVGQHPDPVTGSTIPPIYQTSTYTLEAVGITKGFDYSRSINPTRRMMEMQLASLEGAAHGVAFSSGMAAIHGVTGLLDAGDHIVATQDIYGGTHRLFTDVLSRYGIETTYVDMIDLTEVAGAIRPTTKLLWIETPSNPCLRLTDIRGIVALRRPGMVIGADNTFASPYFQRPLAMGVDVVVHSTTKYLGGHHDLIGGIVVTNDDDIHAKVKFWQNAVGAVPGPWDSYLTTRGAKTLAVRMRQHARNAQAVAEFLSTREDLAEVLYPGLPSHPQHALAKAQMDGFGAIVSIRARGGAAHAYQLLKEFQLFSLATSLGGVESLACSPFTMTHASVPAELKRTLGVSEDLIRFSIGIEDVEDLIADLTQALNATSAYAEIAEEAV
ncbi:MAG TPA: PLP-dependent aspartate aminotransferase family protein [Candidatus Baltobacteraceae bacterium]|jgi:cystathionine beta-lyase/cystathionine gamma-synthase|nr:PLP-dependent aspartate aminotransferase family protein [Candidatus Baltobacteraceae bacterium]